MLFSLYLSLFWELRDKGNLKNLQFWPESLGAMLECWYIERGLLEVYPFLQWSTVLPVPALFAAKYFSLHVSKISAFFTFRRNIFFTQVIKYRLKSLKRFLLSGNPLQRLPTKCFRGSRWREYDVGRRQTKPAVQHVSGHCYGLRSNTVDQHESLFPVKIRNNYASFR